MRPGFSRRVAAAGVALLTAAAAGAQSTPASAGYRIGSGDRLQVRVFEIPQLQLVDLRVTEAGTIQLPVVGEFAVADRTASEVAAALRELLQTQYLQRAPSVDVQVLEFRSKPISVIGAVAEPGPLAVSGRLTLLAALTAAGGLTADHGDQIHILRQADNGLRDRVSIAVSDLTVSNDRRANIPVFANDLINIPVRETVNVYCLGEVNRQGAIPFARAERLTLLAAIAKAGGITDRASGKVIIRRKTATGDREIRVNYKRILDGKENDVELFNEDVLYVKRSIL